MSDQPKPTGEWTERRVRDYVGTYLIWQSMIGRCHRPSDSSYRWYGAKGVTVCDRWRKFEDFFSDMGTAPDGMHIHRTSGSPVYSKDTCVWMNESEHIGLHNTEQGWGARMTRAQLIDALTGAKAQLDAEREKVKLGPGMCADDMPPPRTAADDLREIQQLRDERENYNTIRKALFNEMQEIQKCRSQLAAAQVAMKKAHQFCPPIWAKYIEDCLSGGTTALDAAIAAGVDAEKKRQDFDWGHVKREYLRLQKENEKLAAAQKQLVDALKEQQELWAMASVQLNASDDKSHCVRFMEFHKPLGKISDALSKVKEGK